MQVRCGVNERCSLKEAVDCTLKPMLRRYRRQLPRQRWRAVCGKAMYILRHSVETMQV